MPSDLIRNLPRLEVKCAGIYEAKASQEELLKRGCKAGRFTLDGNYYLTLPLTTEAGCNHTCASCDIDGKRMYHACTPAEISIFREWARSCGRDVVLTQDRETDLNVGLASFCWAAYRGQQLDANQMLTDTLILKTVGTLAPGGLLSTEDHLNMALYAISEERCTKSLLQEKREMQAAHDEEKRQIEAARHSEVEALNKRITELVVDNQQLRIQNRYQSDMLKAARI